MGKSLDTKSTFFRARQIFLQGCGVGTAGDLDLAEEIVGYVKPSRADLTTPELYSQALWREYDRRIDERFLNPGYSRELQKPLGAVA